MLGRVELEQALDQERQASHARRRVEAPFADEADLPQDHDRAGVDRPPPNEEVGRLVALGAGGSRIDAEVGNEAVLGRDPGQHSRAETFGSETPDRLVAGPGEDAGMPVQNCADIDLVPDPRNDLVDDPGVDLAPVLALLVERRQRARLAICPLDPGGARRVVDEVESFVSLLDRQPALRSQMRGCLDPVPTTVSEPLRIFAGSGLRLAGVRLVRCARRPGLRHVPEDTHHRRHMAQEDVPVRVLLL